MAQNAAKPGAAAKGPPDIFSKNALNGRRRCFKILDAKGSSGAPKILAFTLLQPFASLRAKQRRRGRFAL
jgi:hypothetical protein